MKLAIAGVGGLVSEALLEALSDADERPESLLLLAEQDDEELNPLYAGRSKAVQLIAETDFSGLDAVIFVDETELAEAHLERALAAGVDVIDATGWSASLGMGEVVQVGLTDFSLSGGSPRHWVCANPLTVVLAEVLQGLGQLSGLSSADVVACMPVSVAGRKGVDALASEAARLLNGQPLESNDVFDRQIAFNLLPEGASALTGSSVQAELRHLLQNPALRLNLSSVVVPVFYGMTVAVHLNFAEAVNLGEAEQLLASRGFSVAREEDVVSPVSHAREASLTVASLRQEKGSPGFLSCWLVADNIRKGAALNIIQLMEILKKSSI